MEEELPEWLWPYTDNFTGPYWSDGKFQSSVKKGKLKPKSKLDVLSKKHDERYANNVGDNDELFLADLEYYERSRQMSFVPRFIGAIPLYGNFLFRRPRTELLDRFDRGQNLRGEKMRGGRPTYTPAWEEIDGTPSKPPGGNPVKTPEDWWNKPSKTDTHDVDTSSDVAPDVYDPAMWTGDASVNDPVRSEMTNAGGNQPPSLGTTGAVYSMENCVNPWTQTKSRKKKKKNKKLNYICI
jgi:hypothetical protein